MLSFGEGWNLWWLLIILMDSTFLKQNTKTSINLRENNNNNRKKQTIKQEILSLPSLHCFVPVLSLSVLAGD